MADRQKYVRLGQFDEIIIFPEVMDHSRFKNLNPISAGFCEVYKNNVSCFGESISLKLKTKDDDSFYATKQIFGYHAAKNLI